LAVVDEVRPPGPDSPVAVAGSGIGACALACLLRQRGIPVVLLEARHVHRMVTTVIEAVPEAAVALLSEVGLGPALVAAGAAAVDGFENVTPGQQRRLEGRWVHVERHRLAAAAQHAARRRGTQVISMDRVDSTLTNREHAEIVVDGLAVQVSALVDATGRAARWSRPVARRDTSVAQLWTGPAGDPQLPGRVVRDGPLWGYRIDHAGTSTIGIVSAEPRSEAFWALPRLPDLAAALGVRNPAAYTHSGNRAASVQWAVNPVAGYRLSLGDAALAYSPLAGQGVRFAVSSALAAASVIGSWAAGDRALASSYYRSFVRDAQLKHLRALASIDDESETASPESRPDVAVLDDHTTVRFVAAVEAAALSVDARIVQGRCCVLPDGGQVRWVGGLDLLDLQSAVGDGCAVLDITARLTARGYTTRQVRAALTWCARVGVVQATERRIGRPE
jgi:2-polyprenyl-6-methoxyphenol hydroxylase-like FAD-dependent oxidoreductase